MTKLDQKPVIHGRDHLTGGADPIPGLLTGPSGTISAAILATVPGAYYKLDETSGDWIDSSPGGRDATYFSRSGTVRGVASGLDESDGSLCVTVDGGTPSPSHAASYVGAAAPGDSWFDFNGTVPFSVTARVYLAAIPSTIQSLGICGNSTSVAVRWGLYVFGSSSGSSGTVNFQRGGSTEGWSSIPLPTGEWVRITGTYDGATSCLYFDDVLVKTASLSASLSGGTGYETFYLGGVGNGPVNLWAPWQGQLDSVAVWDRALTPSEVGGIAEFETSVGGAGDGWVMTSDGAGGTAWSPPTIEVEF